MWSNSTRTFTPRAATSNNAAKNGSDVASRHIMKYSTCTNRSAVRTRSAFAWIDSS